MPLPTIADTNYTFAAGSGDRRFNADPRYNVFLEVSGAHTGDASSVLDGDISNADGLNVNGSATGTPNILTFDFYVPRLISEWRIYRSGTANSGTYIIEASNDKANWLPVSSTFVAQTTLITVNTAVSNIGFYRYYRMRMTAGSGSGLNNGQFTQIEFKTVAIDGDEGFQNVVDGDRRLLITVTGNMTVYSGGALLNNTVDGASGTNTNKPSMNAANGQYLEFNFADPVLIRGLTLYSSFSGANNASFQWQRYDPDAAAFIDVGPVHPATNGTPLTITTMEGDTVRGTRYRLVKLSGTFGGSSGRYLRQIEFYNSLGSPVTVTSDEPRVDYPIIPTRYTQIPVLVVTGYGDAVANVDITQMPILVITKEAEPVYVTQVPVILPVRPRPIPPPRALVPELPITEYWRYLTVVNIASGGREQRTALRKAPRLGVSARVLALDEAQRRDIWQSLYKYVDKPIAIPVYHYAVHIEPGSTNSAILYAVERTDIRVGDLVALFDVITEVAQYRTVVEDVMEPVYNNATPPEIIGYRKIGVRLDEAVTGSVDYIAPAREWRMSPVATMNLVSMTMTAPLELEAVGTRALRAPGAATLMTLYDGQPVLTPRPIGDRDVTITRDTHWMDNETSEPEAVNRWRSPFVGMNLLFKFNRFTDIEYWRDFANRANGRQNTFIVPTFLNDIPLIAVPALGATVLVTNYLEAHHEFANRSIRYLRLERNNGSVIYRRVDATTITYDGAGQPVFVNILLNTGIGTQFGNNQIRKVSYAYVMRLDSDEIRLEHEALDSYISFPVRAVIE